MWVLDAADGATRADAGSSWTFGTNFYPLWLSRGFSHGFPIPQMIFLVETRHKAANKLCKTSPPPPGRPSCQVTNSFVWTSIVTEGPEEGVHKWSVIFTDPSQQPKFLFELKRCMYEASTQMPFANVKVCSAL